MVGWTEIFDDVDGSPIRGERTEFERTASFYRDMSDFASGIHAEFQTITSGGVEELQGQAATAFVGVVDDVAGSLDDVPRVADDVVGLLETHIGRLESLHERAETGAHSALARARVSWNERNDALDDVTREDRSLRSYRWQLDQLPAPGTDPASDQERRRLERHRSSAWSRRSDAEQRRNAADGRLVAIRDEWQELREEEDRLNRELADAIDDIRLGDLSDPGLLDKVLGAAVGFILFITPFDEIFDFVSAVVTAIADGDWGTLLHILSDALGTVLFVLGVVALFVAGPVLAVVLAITAVVALVKIAVDSYLYFSQTVDGRTGEPMSGIDFAFNIVGSVLALGGASAGLATYRGLGPAARSFATSDMLSNVASSSRLGQRGSQAINVIDRLSLGATVAQRGVNYVIDVRADGFWSASLEHAPGVVFDHADSLWPAALVYEQLPGGYEEQARDYSVIVNGDGAGDVLTEWAPDPNASFWSDPGGTVPFDLTPRPVIVDIEIVLPFGGTGPVGPVLPEIPAVDLPSLPDLTSSATIDGGP